MSLWSYMTQGHFFKYQLQIVECCGHKAVAYGEKYCKILESQTTFIVKYSCPSCILLILLKNHIFLTNVIVYTSFEKIYLEQGSLHTILEWQSTTFLIFHHQFKIFSTTWYFHAPPYNPGGLLYFWSHFNWKNVCFLIVHQDKWNTRLLVSDGKWTGSHRSFIQCEGLIFTRLGFITCSNTTF